MKSESRERNPKQHAVSPPVVAGLCMAVFGMIAVILGYAAWTAQNRYGGDHLRDEVRLAMQRGETVAAPQMTLEQPLPAKR
jgi:hypothetical protein